MRELARETKLNSLRVCSNFEREPKKFKNERKWNLTLTLSLYMAEALVRSSLALLLSPSLLLALYLHRSVLGTSHSLSLYAGEFARFFFLRSTLPMLSLALALLRARALSLAHPLSSQKSLALALTLAFALPLSLALALYLGRRVSHDSSAYCQRIRRRMLTYADVC